MNKTIHPFRVMVEKEVCDCLRSWKFIMMAAIMVLTCLGSLYTALGNIGSLVKPGEPEGAFLFLKLFTATDGTLPSFSVFIGFIGPLLGVAMGFDAVNSEYNKGTLSRLLSQPIYRDTFLHAKFTAALLVIGTLFFSLGLSVIGCGLVAIGIPPSAEEFLRMMLYLLVSSMYVAFWLNLSILFSTVFRQPATSALAGISVWIFFSVFYGLILNLIGKSIAPSAYVPAAQVLRFQQVMQGLARLNPGELFNEATATLLMPSVRSIGPLTMERLSGAIPGTLSLGQSILVSWPQLTCLVAATAVCFGVCYYLFMRREIRPR